MKTVAHVHKHRGNAVQKDASNSLYLIIYLAITYKVASRFESLKCHVLICSEYHACKHNNNWEIEHQQQVIYSNDNMMVTYMCACK